MNEMVKILAPVLAKKPAPAAELSPDDLVIVQRRQDWRLRVAAICLGYFETCRPEDLCGRRTLEQVRALRVSFARLSDYIKRDLGALLVTGISVHDLEAVRFQVNYFLEEIVRHVRTQLSSRKQSKNPLQNTPPEEIEREVCDALAVTAESLVVFVEDLVRLTEFELEVGNQRERIRLLLGGDRRLSGLGNNEAIMTAPLEQFWSHLDDFLSVYSYVRENLPPLLDKASPYSDLEEELKVAKEQLSTLLQDRLEPFEMAQAKKRRQDDAWLELENELDKKSRQTIEIREIRLEPLLRQLKSGRGGLIKASEVGHLYSAVLELGSEFGTFENGAAKTPTEEVGKTLESVSEASARLLGTVFAIEGAPGELPDDPVLETMLADLGLPLVPLGKSCDAAVASLSALREAEIHPLREHFCTLMGELRTFLQTSFAHIASKDPRSTESSYHFFLREFSNESHQAILLLKEIRELEVYINSLRRFNIAGLPLTPENLARILRVLFVDKDEEKKRIPSGEGWRVMSAFLEKLKNEFVPRLQKVYSLDGIRYEDKNFLSEWSMELTRNCTLCLAQHEIGYSLLQEMGRLRDDLETAASQSTHQHIVTAKTCNAMQKSLTEICMTLTASIPYVGIMKGGVERRASVFFHRQQVLREGEGPEKPSAAE